MCNATRSVAPEFMYEPRLLTVMQPRIVEATPVRDRERSASLIITYAPPFHLSPSESAGATVRIPAVVVSLVKNTRSRLRLSRSLLIKPTIDYGTPALMNTGLAGSLRLVKKKRKRKRIVNFLFITRAQIYILSEREIGKKESVNWNKQLIDNYLLTCLKEVALV